jgi:hypothetical protein
MKVVGMTQGFNIPVVNVGGWLHHNLHLQVAVANGIQGVLLLDMEGRPSYIKKSTLPKEGWFTLPDRAAFVEYNERVQQEHQEQ